MEIYIDVVFLENVVINYLILLVTARFSKVRTSSFRLLMGSLLGACYLVIMIIMPQLEIFTTVLTKLLLSFAIVAVTFSFERLNTFFKTMAVFYASTFVFAGGGFALLYLNKSGGIIKNGVAAIFFQTKWTEIFLGIAFASIVARVLWDVVQHRFLKDRLLVPLIISFDKKAIGLYALVDTGNSLHDPLTNMPVVVVEFNAIKEILPEEIRLIFEKDAEGDLNSITTAISGSTWFSRFRLIPFTSLGKENGLLIGFRPDYIEIGSDDEKKGIRDVIVGIYNNSLSKNEKYKALLNPELI